MHFIHISAKSPPKILKLVHYLFLAVRGNIQLEGPGPTLATPLCDRNLMIVLKDFVLSIKGDSLNTISKYNMFPFLSVSL